MFSVPQFIDVEDKVAGPLTWRQIFWMMGMTAALLFFYNLFDRALFFVVAVPTILFFSVFAFYRPNGVSMITFALYAVFYFFQPKVSVWERPVAQGAFSKRESVDRTPIVGVPTHKELDTKKIQELAKILDGK